MKNPQKIRTKYAKLYFRLNTNTRMPSKDMKKFLHEFFNPPKATGGTQTKVKTGKKKVKIKREREIR